MRIRTVKPEWLEDEKLGAASDEARVLSVGLVLLADDYGRGRAHDGFVAGHVWPYGDPRETLAKSSRAMRELSGLGFVTLYEVRGQSYFEIRTWERHQKVDHPGKPMVPPPSEGVVQIREDSRDSRETLAPDLDLDLDQDLDHDHEHARERSRGKASGSRLDPSWEPDDAMRDWAASEPAVQLGRRDVDSCLAEFRDYWAGVSGARGRKADWPATFRNSLRRYRQLHPNAPKATKPFVPRQPVAPVTAIPASEIAPPEAQQAVADLCGSLFRAAPAPKAAGL